MDGNVCRISGHASAHFFLKMYLFIFLKYILNEVGNVRTCIIPLICSSLQSVMANTERKSNNMNISDTGNEVFMREVEVRKHFFHFTLYLYEQCEHYLRV